MTKRESLWAALDSLKQRGVQLTSLEAKLFENAGAMIESGRSGLPCPDCEQPQERINVRWVGDTLLVNLSFAVSRDESAKEIKGVNSLLRMFVR